MMEAGTRQKCLRISKRPTGELMRVNLLLSMISILLLTLESAISRPGSAVDPRTDKLLKFEGEDYSSPSSRTNTFALFCISVFMYLFYQVISRNSSRIQRSLLQAKLMVNLKGDKNRKV